MNTLFLFLIILLFSSKSFGEDAPIVEIPYGQIQGNFQTSYGGRTFTAFEGIPYAKTVRRFEDPEPPEKWNGILKANKEYLCAQFIPVPMMFGFHGTEDCLYLYVYVPRKKITAGENLPVVVHIHGGAFMVGAPKIFALPDYMMDQDIILVTMNYRLGVLGFLSTGDEVASGNYGIKDQSMALKWIKENIKYFGGNPDSITLNGQSAGSASVLFHYISPWSKGLFARGIAQSGSCLAPWSMKRDPLKYAKLAASYVNCTTEDNHKMIDCLKEKNYKDVTKSYKATLLGGVLPLNAFGPVIENGKNPFIREDPYKLLKEGKFYDVPLILTTMSDEGVFFIGMLTFFGKIPSIEKEWTKYAPYLLDYVDSVSNDKMDQVSKKIKDHYFKHKRLTNRNAEILGNLLADRLFLTSVDATLRLFSKISKSPVYYGVIDYLLQQRFFLPVKPRPTHGDDVKLYLKTFISPKKLKPIDEAMIKAFTSFIYSYALNGIPKFGNVEWKPVKPGAKEFDYLLISGPNNATMKSKKELVDIQFWDSLEIREYDRLYF